MSPTDRPEHTPQPDETSDPATAGGGSDRPPHASVAEEAAKLVELLSQRGWAASSGTPSGSSSRPGGGAGDAEQADRTGPSDEPGAGECTCGGKTPSACRVCPVCQVIALVQQVSPDTIERVADFVGFAATALRELAVAQRERQPPRDEEGTGPGGGT